MAEDWSAKRREVVAAQERALAHARQAEHAKATALLRDAARDFEAAGIAPHPLSAHPYSGSRPVKTTLVGWYLKMDRTVGFDPEGRYYILSAPGDLLTRLRGASIEATDAPLVVGRGGRDGEAIELSILLSLRRRDPVPPATLTGGR